MPYLSKKFQKFCTWSRSFWKLKSGVLCLWPQDYLRDSINFQVRDILVQCYAEEGQLSMQFMFMFSSRICSEFNKRAGAGLWKIRNFHIVNKTIRVRLLFLDAYWRAEKYIKQAAAATGFSFVGEKIQNSGSKWQHLEETKWVLSPSSDLLKYLVKQGSALHLWICLGINVCVKPLFWYRVLHFSSSNAWLISSLFMLPLIIEKPSLVVSCSKSPKWTLVTYMKKRTSRLWLCIW